MENKFDKNFFRYLVLHCLDYLPLVPLNVDDLSVVKTLDSIKFAVNIIRSDYYSWFLSLFSRIPPMDWPEERLICHLRNLNLCDKNEEFLLLCAVMVQLAHFVVMKWECFYYTDIAAGCISKLFDEKYREILSETDRWKEFERYCDLTVEQKRKDYEDQPSNDKTVDELVKEDTPWCYALGKRIIFYFWDQFEVRKLTEAGRDEFNRWKKYCDANSLYGKNKFFSVFINQYDLNLQRRLTRLFPSAGNKKFCLGSYLTNIYPKVKLNEAEKFWNKVDHPRLKRDDDGLNKENEDSFESRGQIFENTNSSKVGDQHLTNFSTNKELSDAKECLATADNDQSPKKLDTPRDSSKVENILEDDSSNTFKETDENSSFKLPINLGVFKKSNNEEPVTKVFQDLSNFLKSTTKKNVGSRRVINFSSEEDKKNFVEKYCYTNMAKGLSSQPEEEIADDSSPKELEMTRNSSQMRNNVQELDNQGPKTENIFGLDLEWTIPFEPISKLGFSKADDKDLDEIQDFEDFYKMIKTFYNEKTLIKLNTKCLSLAESEVSIARNKFIKSIFRFVGVFLAILGVRTSKTIYYKLTTVKNIFVSIMKIFTFIMVVFGSFFCLQKPKDKENASKIDPTPRPLFLECDAAQNTSHAIAKSIKATNRFAQTELNPSSSEVQPAETNISPSSVKGDMHPEVVFEKNRPIARKDSSEDALPVKDKPDDTISRVKDESAEDEFHSIVESDKNRSIAREESSEDALPVKDKPDDTISRVEDESSKDQFHSVVESEKNQPITRQDSSEDALPVKDKPDDPISRVEDKSSKDKFHSIVESEKNQLITRQDSSENALPVVDQPDNKILPQLPEPERILNLVQSSLEDLHGIWVLKETSFFNEEYLKLLYKNTCSCCKSDCRKKLIICMNMYQKMIVDAVKAMEIKKKRRNLK